MASPVYFESFNVKKENFKELKVYIGIDFGSALIKIVCAPNYTTQSNSTNVTLLCATFPSEQVDTSVDWLIKHGDLTPGGELKITGLFARDNQEIVEAKTGMKVQVIEEQIAHSSGIHFLLENFSDEEITFPIPPNVEKGKEVNLTKFTKRIRESMGVKLENHSRLPCIYIIAGSQLALVMALSEQGRCKTLFHGALSGQTFSGLAQLVVGTGDYDEFMKLSEKGDRKKVDLLSGDVFSMDLNSPYSMDPNMTMMPFGKIFEIESDTYSNADLAKSLVSTMMINLFSQFSIIAVAQKVNRIYIGGNLGRSEIFRTAFFSNNIFLNNNIGFEYFFLKTGHATAIGAMITQ